LRPGSFGRRGTGQVAQLGQGHVHLYLGRLPGTIGQHPGRDQPPAGLRQGVMTALGGGADILLTCSFA
jgi:hypothetical protein